VGELTALPQSLAEFKGATSQRRMKGRVKRAGGKGGQGRDWKKGEWDGRDRGERKGVDLAPPCKNFCGRPWITVIHTQLYSPKHGRYKI